MTKFIVLYHPDTTNTPTAVSAHRGVSREVEAHAS